MLSIHCDLCGESISTAATSAAIDRHETGGDPAVGSAGGPGEAPSHRTPSHHTVDIRVRSPHPDAVIGSRETFDADALDTLADLLAREEAGHPLPSVGKAAAEGEDRTFRYDLCPDCYARYRRDPIGLSWRNRLPATTPRRGE